MTTVEGYQLIDTRIYNNAIERLETVCVSIKPLRETLLHDISKLSQLDKNGFAKSIRLLDKFTKQVEGLCLIQL